MSARDRIAEAVLIKLVDQDAVRALVADGSKAAAVMASMAYALADAMLVERAKDEPLDTSGPGPEAPTGKRSL